MVKLSGKKIEAISNMLRDAYETGGEDGENENHNWNNYFKKNNIYIKILELENV